MEAIHGSKLGLSPLARALARFLSMSWPQITLSAAVVLPRLSEPARISDALELDSETPLLSSVVLSSSMGLKEMLEGPGWLVMTPALALKSLLFISASLIGVSRWSGLPISIREMR